MFSLIDTAKGATIDDLEYAIVPDLLANPGITVCHTMLLYPLSHLNICFAVVELKYTAVARV